MARNTTEKLSVYLDNELRMRYSPDSILPYDDNKVIHRFFKDQYTATEAKTFRIMNDNIIRMSYSLVKYTEPRVGGNPLSFDTPLTQHLLDELNIRPTKEDFQKIRDQKLKMCVVGYGGAMLNMLYNMYIWSMELSETKVFEKIVIFEKDDLDFSNILRMGKPMIFDYTPDFIKPYDSDVPQIKTLKKINMLGIEKELAKDRKLVLFSDWLVDTSADYIDKNGYFFVGAPTLDTRTMLQDKKFFFLGHSDHEVDITYSPQNISTLAVETYGSIDIPVLLINLQLATAAFIKILANGEDHEVNQRLLNFDMKKWVDENPEKLKELYNV
jgi:hypothetical protein